MDKNVFEPDGVYAGVPYKVLNSGQIDTLISGGVVRFKSFEHMIESLSASEPASFTSNSAVAKAIPVTTHSRSSSRSAWIIVLCIAVVSAIIISLTLSRRMVDHEADAIEIIKQNLFDADSAQFRNVRQVKIGSLPVVCGYVNAKNRFGGFVGMRPFVHVPSLAQSYIFDGNNVNSYTAKQFGYYLEACGMSVP